MPHVFSPPPGPSVVPQESDSVRDHRDLIATASIFGVVVRPGCGRQSFLSVPTITRGQSSSKRQVQAIVKISSRTAVSSRSIYHHTSVYFWTSTVVTTISALGGGGVCCWVGGKPTSGLQTTLEESLLLSRNAICCKKEFIPTPARVLQRAK